jgi:hypothetical protein
MACRNLFVLRMRFAATCATTISNTSATPHFQYFLNLAKSYAVTFAGNADKSFAESESKR